VDPPGNFKAATIANVAGGCFYAAEEKEKNE
jgi:hypothetical protein